MNSRAWHLVHWLTTDDADTRLRELEDIFPALRDLQFTVRRPILGQPQPGLDPSTFRDGTRTDWMGAKTLLRKQFDDPYEVNCELESSGDVRIHVGEDCVYVYGRPAEVRQASDEPAISQVESSPWDLETQGWTYAPFPTLDSQAARLELAASIGGSGVLVLVQWAVGAGGRIWTWVQRMEDLSTLLARTTPRDLVVAFDPRWFARVPDLHENVPDAFPLRFDSASFYAVGAPGDWRSGETLAEYQMDLDIAGSYEEVAGALPGDAVLVFWPAVGRESDPWARVCADDDGVARLIGDWA